MNTYYSRSKIHGFGVFAKKNIKKGVVLSIDPVILVPSKELKYLDKTILAKYYFDFGKKFGAVCLGWGSLYNHSYDANATFEINIKNQTITFTSVKNIKKGEEIFINYNQKPDDKTPLETWWDSDFSKDKNFKK